MASGFTIRVPDIVPLMQPKKCQKDKKKIVGQRPTLNFQIMRGAEGSVSVILHMDAYLQTISQRFVAAENRQIAFSGKWLILIGPHFPRKEANFKVKRDNAEMVTREFAVMRC